VALVLGSRFTLSFVPLSCPLGITVVVAVLVVPPGGSVSLHGSLAVIHSSSFVTPRPRPPSHRQDTLDRRGRVMVPHFTVVLERQWVLLHDAAPPFSTSVWGVASCLLLGSTVAAAASGGGSSSSSNSTFFSGSAASARAAVAGACAGGGVRGGVGAGAGGGPSSALAPDAVASAVALFRLIDVVLGGHLPKTSRHDHHRDDSAVDEHCGGGGGGGDDDDDGGGDDVDDDGYAHLPLGRGVRDRSQAAYTQFVWDSFASGDRNAASGGGGGGDLDDDDALCPWCGGVVSAAQLRVVCGRWCHEAVAVCRNLGGSAAQALAVSALANRVEALARAAFGLGGGGAAGGGADEVDYAALTRAFAATLRCGAGLGPAAFDAELGDTASLLHVLDQGHCAAVSSCAFLPRAGLLVTASSGDGDVRVWDARAPVVYLGGGGGGGSDGRLGASSRLQTLLPSLQLQFRCRADGASMRVVKRPLLTERQRGRARRVSLCVRARMCMCVRAFVCVRVGICVNVWCAWRVCVCVCRACVREGSLWVNYCRGRRDVLGLGLHVASHVIICASPRAGSGCHGAGVQQRYICCCGP
jgi:hypothetical protein